MTLTEYIEKVKLENNISYPTENIEQYIMDKAHDKAVHNVAAVDDETIRQWIIEYRPTPTEMKNKPKVPTAEELRALKTPKVEKPVGITEKREGEWGEQQSLF